MSFAGVKLPQIDSWSKYLDLRAKVELQDLINPLLLDPLKEFLDHSGKNIRPQLVELGFRLAMKNEDEEIVTQASKQLMAASTVIEAIHSGTLIIDDIQDESVVRRNRPALHLQLGIPKALTAGNWLYFWALEQIRHMGLDPETERALIFDTLKMMTRGHYGQAIDVGVNIDEVEQSRVHDICLASMELKTGTLFSMAFRLGLAIHQSKFERPELLALASRFGVGLQALDDVGNFLSAKSDEPSKRHEDLRNKRPTWVWAQASKLDQKLYQDFIDATRALPDEQQLDEWIQKNEFKTMLIESAQFELQSSAQKFELFFEKTHPRATRMIKDIVQKLEYAYVKP